MSILDDYTAPSPTIIQPGLERWPLLLAAIRDARAVTGRSEDTGLIVRTGHHQTWLGAAGYLVLMDQVGTAVGRSDLASAEQQLMDDVSHCASIGRCLAQFSDCTAPQIAALYALRCSLAHDFGLVNRYERGLTNPKKDQPDLRHAFNLVPDAPPALVQLPQAPWDGQYPVTGQPTIVNMLALGDLSEEVYRRVVAAHRRGALITRCPDDEFTARYFMLVGTPV